MSKRILFDVDPVGGMVQYIEPDPDGVTIITTATNIQQVLDENARKRAVHTQAPRGDQTLGNHVASIPAWQWEQFCRENPELRQWTKDAQVWLVNKLRSRDYEKLRTFDGRI